MKKRKKYSPHFKAKVAWEALEEKETITALSSKYGVHRTLIQRWKAQSIRRIHEVFASEEKQKDQDKLIKKLEKKVAQLQAEYDWLSKKLEE